MFVAVALSSLKFLLFLWFYPAFYSLYLIGNPLPPPTILNSYTAGPIINLYCTLFVIDCTCNNIMCV